MARMEANAVHELHEQHEQALGEHEEHAPAMKYVSFAMSLLAVLVAVVTVLGHRSHTEAVLSQARASDQWGQYQAKRIRQNETALAQDLLSALPVRDTEAVAKTLGSYKERIAQLGTDLGEEDRKAREFEADVERAEHRAGRYDLGEALLEIGLVITSITLLTRRRAYWYLGMIFGAAGIVVAAQGFLLH
jgi:hypothetical protein